MQMALFMLLPALKQLKSFTFDANILCPIFLTIKSLYYRLFAAYCQFQLNFYSRFYPGTWVLIVKRPGQSDDHKRHLAVESGERL